MCFKTTLYAMSLNNPSQSTHLINYFIFKRIVLLKKGWLEHFIYNFLNLVYSIDLDWGQICVWTIIENILIKIFDIEITYAKCMTDRVMKYPFVLTWECVTSCLDAWSSCIPDRVPFKHMIRRTRHLSTVIATSKVSRDLGGCNR